nr:immunoglobulin heavy chain junction region [Macaca mulatta]MOY22427.1 immunoglobulin heavy chain junction region [Macaca mulatta]MOY22801.1 immunoglobulin heavy chain junction region [Macaca mulatta]MOY23018.1 immunoglobulin heavy chain junction region [Macaca mulatta]MOY23260.1 immunoglobulin heavy chain junction region [Macaca mulatta]
CSRAGSGYSGYKYALDVW